MAKKKTILVEVENKQLDALEDLLTAELTPEEEATNRKAVLKLWKRLVVAWDESNADLNNKR